MLTRADVTAESTVGAPPLEETTQEPTDKKEKKKSKKKSRPVTGGDALMRAFAAIHLQQALFCLLID